MMALHPLAAKFAGVAGEYERGRPDYPPAAVGALAAELGLAPGARVLDLAAGTGKLTRALAAHGLDVVAVEPQEPLRALLAGSGANEVLEGIAERIPLADASVDAITVADGFHWFDREKALPEMRRVLRPGGGLALVSTAPDWGETSWGEAAGDLISSSRGHHPFFDETSFEDTLRAAPDWADPRLITVIARQPADADRLVDYVQSFSWVAGMADDERAAFTGKVRDLLAAGVPETLPVRYFMWLSARA
jgi:ubiquinone/menaquinone biosynthesis C-methylase UbiE